jgi:hypothetical protein
MKSSIRNNRRVPFSSNPYTTFGYFVGNVVNKQRPSLTVLLRTIFENDLQTQAKLEIVVRSLVRERNLKMSSTISAGRGGRVLETRGAEYDSRGENVAIRALIPPG